jgi:hypothetical protein
VIFSTVIQFAALPLLYIVTRQIARQYNNKVTGQGTGVKMRNVP